MAGKPNFDRPKSGKETVSGFAKMQMGHRRTRDQIKRIQAENAERTSTGKPRHSGHAQRP